MTKADEKKHASNVESAIRSLYEKFKSGESGRYGGCVDVKTKETAALKKRIAEREEELSNDAKLKKLKAELKKLQCDTVMAMNAQHQRVDEMLRKFQVRGVSPDLLDEIDEMSKEEPAYVENCGCDVEDDE